uniref:C2H2-type domain-containing protein n=1 Tax=Rhodnius prolixus TaxID=13249 RepID=T1HQ33_RHOPR
MTIDVDVPEKRKYLNDICLHEIILRLILASIGKISNCKQKKKSRHYCVDCGKSYKNKSGLLQHRKYECGKEPQFSCPFCDYKVKLRCNLLKHIGIKHESMAKDYYQTFQKRVRHACQGCNKSYKYKEGLYLHQRYECGKDPQFQCPYCAHRAKHKGNVFNCLKCGKNYLSSGGLRNHLAFECGKAPQFKCRFCPYEAKIKGGNYDCEKCGKRYRSKTALNNHVRCECGKEPQYKCRYCPYQAKLKGCNYDCHICGKRYSSQGALYNHVKFVCGTTKCSSCNCNGCGRRYVCDGCGKSYASACGLKTHTKWECGKEPNFNCPHCSYKTKRKGSLKRHMLTLHNPMKFVETTTTEE